MLYVKKMFLKCSLLLFYLISVEADYRFPSRIEDRCSYRSLTHGRVRYRQKMKFAEYRCYRPFTLVGNKYATCRNGQWDVEKPICVAPGCEELPEIENAIKVESVNGSWVSIFCLPEHRLVGSPVLYCDGREWNSTVPECTASKKAVPATACDFEKPDLCGWTQDILHDMDWLRHNRRTPSYYLETGPSYDHTFGKNGTGYYMYVESSIMGVNDTARLLSPVYDKALTKDGCFVFFYHMYGLNTGGLRVYQKPDSVDLAVLRRSGSERDKYLLFEIWGEQGNKWYDSVMPLKELSEDFQIVIEGVPSVRLTSDMAFDDVAILQGENCTLARKAATTPEVPIVESCVGRCDIKDEGRYSLRCSCHFICLIYNNCCPDYLEVCEYGSNSTVSDDPIDLANTTMEMPQTQKLVATTTQLSTRPTSTTTSTTSTTTTIIPRQTITTRQKPTTTTPKTTNVETTKQVYRSTTVTRNTYRNISSTKTSTRMYQTTTAAPKVTKKKALVNNTSTTLTNKPIVVTETTTRSTPKTTMKINVTNINAMKTVIKDKPEGVSKTEATIIAAVIIVVICGLVVGYFATGARRYSVVARLRGRVQGESEVRYLTSDVDDE